MPEIIPNTNQIVSETLVSETLTSEMRISRFTTPTRFDLAPFGMICKVRGEQENDFEYFIQTCREKDIASWIKFETFMGIVLKDLIDDQEFINILLNLYKNQKYPTQLKNLLVLSPKGVLDPKVDQLPTDL